MPDAYENYMTFANHMQKLGGASLRAPSEINYFTYDYGNIIFLIEYSCLFFFLFRYSNL